MPTKKEKDEAKKKPVSKKAESKEIEPEKVGPEKVEPKTETKALLASPENKKSEPLVSFARWFMSKKFKPHWAAGMQAYTDTRRRRTVADWDRLFEKY